MRPVLCVAAALLVGQGVIGADDVVSREALTAAALKSLDLLVKTSPAFIKKGGCNSCHNQTLPAAAQTFARSRGIPVGDPIEQLPPDVSDATLERYAEYSVAGGGGAPAGGLSPPASSLPRRHRTPPQPGHPANLSIPHAAK